MTSDKNRRKILLDLAVTLDGFIEGKNGEIDWCIMEEEMNFPGFLEGIDAIFFGRRSFEAWMTYEPENGYSEEDLKTLDNIRKKDHYVFTMTLKEHPADVTLIGENIEEEVNAIRNRPGKDIWLYGGSNLITTFMNLGLVDELRLSVHPILLGEGKPLFIDLKERAKLVLVKTNTYPSGVVQLIYHFEK